MMGKGGKAGGATITADVNGGGDYTSIQESINASNPGDTVQVREGVYKENIVIDKMISLVGDGSEHTKIQPLKPTTGVRITANYAIFERFGISSTLSWGIVIEANFTSISSNSVTNCTNGLILSSGFSNLIQDNTFSNHLENAIMLVDSSFNTIRNNTCSQSKTGMFVEDSDMNYLQNNTVINNVDGIHVSWSDKISIFWNTCSNNSNQGIYLSQGSDNCLIYENSFAGNDVGISTPWMHKGFNTPADHNTFERNTCIYNRLGVSFGYLRNASITRNHITRNTIGMWFHLGSYSPDNSITHNNIYLNLEAAINLSYASDNPISAINNYWGSAAGPYHTTSNPEGEGDNITGNVSFLPWIYRFIDVDDVTPPDAPWNFTVESPYYKFNSNYVTLLQRGESYNITVNAPSIIDDPSMSRVVFQAQFDEHGWNGWRTIKSDYNVNDNNYTVSLDTTNISWVYSLRARAYDYLNQSSIAVTFYKFYVVGYLSDLKIRDMTFSNSSAISGTNISISVILHNDGPDPGIIPSGGNMLLVIDSDGDPQYYGSENFGPIDPNINNSPEDPTLSIGDLKTSMNWTAPILRHGEVRNFTLRIRTSIQDYTVDIDRSNNEVQRNITVIGESLAPPEIEVVYENTTNANQYFSIQSYSNVLIQGMEYRIGGSENWIQASISYGLYNSYGYIEINTTSMADGNYTIEIRAYDGVYYSNSLFRSFEVSGHPEDDDDNDSTGFYILLLVLGLLLVSLFSVGRYSNAPPSSNESQSTEPPAHAHSLPPRSASQTTGEFPMPTTPAHPPLPSFQDFRHSQSLAHATHAATNTSDATKIRSNSSSASVTNQAVSVVCQHCGSTISSSGKSRSISISCPDCGKETIKTSFQ